MISDWKTEIKQHLADLRLAPTREVEIVEELAQHLEDRYEELLVSGLTEAEAFRTAMGELNESDSLLRELRRLPGRDARRVARRVEPEPIAIGANSRSNLVANLWQDLRYGAR